MQTKAEDSSVVHKTGNETITGAKTFNSGVNFLGSGDSNAVTLSTNTRINVNGTNKTVLGFGSSSFYINHGDYTLLLRGKATRPTYNGADMALASDVTAKQDKLVSGTNIKTINGTSILGSGDITIEGGATLTEADIATMGFTKNTGTYSKPSGGIPKSDLDSAVQTSLGKADTALQSYTEQYKGTVTGVTINGKTKNPSSGVVDLGYINKQLSTSTSSSMTLSPNIYYRNTSTSLSSLTITLGGVSNSNIINEYFIEFTTRSAGTTVSLPSTVKWANGETPTFENGKTYQISIVNNLGVCIKFG